MTIYLEMSENNSGFMNGHPLYNNARKASWDGDTMDIEIKDSGDAMSISLDKEDLVDLLGRSCNKTPLDKRLGNLLTSSRNTRGSKTRGSKTRGSKTRGSKTRSCKTPGSKTRGSKTRSCKTPGSKTHSRNIHRRNTRRLKPSHTRFSNLLNRPRISIRGSSCQRRRQPSVVSPVTCYV